jgi:hypothetical protein
MPLNQQQLEKEGIYEAKAPLAALLADLDQIARFTEIAAARKKRHAKIGGFTMLGGLVLAFILTPLGVLAIVVGLGWWIYSFFAGGKLVKHPVRVGVATERLKMIQEDAGAKAQFSLKLALATKPVKLRDEAWSHRKNGKQEFFEEDWFALQGQLLDGTYLNDDVKELLRKRHFTNPRGKSKTKTRTQYLVNVRLSYPASVYADARPAEKALHGQIKVGTGAMLRAVRVNEKAIVLKAVVSQDREIATTMGMLSVGAYRILNLARKVAVKGANK